MPRNLLACLLVVTLAACRDEPQPAAPPGPAAPATQAATNDPGLAIPAADAAPAEATGLALEQLLRADDTLESARSRLGEKNVVARTIEAAEGELIAAWVLFPDVPERLATAYLDETGRHPTLLQVEADVTQWQRADGSHAASAWRRRDGVHMGMTSTALETLNGRRFSFYGFEWDYGGTITEWHDGKLGPGSSSFGPVTLCMPDVADGQGLPDDYPSGDSLFDSDHPALLAHPAVVCGFAVTLNPARS
jgi:hypothetical protein